MNNIQRYGSLIIKFDANQNMYLTPAKGSSIIREVLPDASEFVSLYCKDIVVLTGLDVPDLYVRPCQSTASLVKEYRSKLSARKKVESASEPILGF